MRYEKEKLKLDPRKRCMQLFVQVRRLSRHCQIFSFKHVQKSVRLHHGYPKPYIKFMIKRPSYLKTFVRFSKKQVH